MSLVRLRPLLVGRSREWAVGWAAIAAVLAVLAFVDGHHEGLSTTQLHGYWVVRLLWPGIGIVAAAVQAARNRSLLLSWLLVFAPLFGEGLYLVPRASLRPPETLLGVVQSALAVAGGAAVTVGSLAFLLGRIGARVEAGIGTTEDAAG